MNDNEGSFRCITCGKHANRLFHNFNKKSVGNEVIRIEKCVSILSNVISLFILYNCKNMYATRIELNIFISDFIIKSAKLKFLIKIFKICLKITKMLQIKVTC